MLFSRSVRVIHPVVGNFNEEFNVVIIEELEGTQLEAGCVSLSLPATGCHGFGLSIRFDF